MGILGPSFKAVSNSQVKLQVSKYVLLGSAIKPLFAERSHIYYFLKFKIKLIRDTSQIPSKLNIV